MKDIEIFVFVKFIFGKTSDISFLQDIYYMENNCGVNEWNR